MDLVSLVAQGIAGLGILNVWLLRSRLATPYRGGSARTLREEFQVYGLPHPVFIIVGTLKVLSAIGLLAGVWFPALVGPSAITLALLMIGALAMHVKVKDPISKSTPAACVLALCIIILVT